MAAAPCRKRRLNALVAFAVLAVARAAMAGDETTFDSGPELGQRLLHDVVKIESRYLAEHGFGLVVGVDQRHAYIATARHVVARRPPAGLDGPERASGEIAVGFCALQAAPPQGAELLGAFDGAADDLTRSRRCAGPHGGTGGQFFQTHAARQQLDRQGRSGPRLEAELQDPDFWRFGCDRAA
jgi:hypothetical protein